MQLLTCVVALHDNEVKLEMTLSVKETLEKYQVEEKYVVKSTTLLGGSLPLYFHFVNHTTRRHKKRDNCIITWCVGIEFLLNINI